MLAAARGDRAGGGEIGALTEDVKCGTRGLYLFHGALQLELRRWRRCISLDQGDKRAGGRKGEEKSGCERSVDSSLATDQALTGNAERLTHRRRRLDFADERAGLGAKKRLWLRLGLSRRLVRQLLLGHVLGGEREKATAASATAVAL